MAEKPKFSSKKIRISERKENLIFILITHRTQENKMEEFDISGRNIYKISMGALLKDQNYRHIDPIQSFENNGLVVMHKNTGVSQGHKFLNEIEIGDYVYLTYGRDRLGDLYRITSDPKPITDEINIDLSPDWVCRKVESVKSPLENNTKSLKRKLGWLPSGNSTFKIVRNLNQANDLLFEPFYNVKIVDSTSRKYKSDWQLVKLVFQRNNIEKYDYFTQTDLRKKIEIDDDQYAVDVKFNDIVYSNGRILNNGRLNLGKSNNRSFLEDNPSLETGKEITVHIKVLDDFETDNFSDVNTDLNFILYGPPGTGKTYNTINWAVAIIENKSVYTVEDENREDVRKRYDKYIDQGQIVFTTFHQSLSYEDFIEGIKPNLSEDSTEDTEGDRDKLDYIIKKGIFRQICQKARQSVVSQIDFEDIWENFVEDLLNTQEEVNFKSISSELKLEKDESSEKSLRVRFKKSHDPTLEEGRKTFIVSKNTINKLYTANVNGSEDYANGRKDTAEIIGPGRATHTYAVYKKFYASALEIGAFDNTAGKKYVLIIDEINRGNISNIFGELITLIENDKREDRDEALELTLPYSNDSFSVPSNLYILGTMNTADRSVEALDTALRRRFSFVEMMPSDDDVSDDFDGIDLKEVLNTINERVELLVDRDHTIGHSYFMNLNGLDDLVSAFKDKIVPLLQEYFYGDYGKIGLVLGNGFVKQNDNSSKEFSSFKYPNKRDFVTDTYTLKEISTENIKVAIDELLMTDKKVRKEKETEKQKAEQEAQTEESGG